MLAAEERRVAAAIEGGARCGYVNPDDTTFEYLRGRLHAPEGEAFTRAEQGWRALASGPDAQYDDQFDLSGGAIAPSVTWGINPGQNVGVEEGDAKK